MTPALLVIALAFLVVMAASLALLFRGASTADTLLSALLLGTLGVALALVLSAGLGLERGTDVALVFALLAAILGTAFVQRGWPPESGNRHPKP